MKKNKGFTLTEVIITIGILMIISVPLYFVLTDSTHKANVATARDFIKQEANKVLNVLENDLTQARLIIEDEKIYSLKVEGNNYSIKVKKSQKDDKVDLKYTFEKPKLHRYFEGKCWLVSKYVDSFEITKSIDGSPGKYTISLVMKANQVGLKDEEQPIYEQNKIIVIMEEATREYDPYWREVEDISDFFTTKGSVLAGLKEDATKMIQDFADTWNKTLGDVKSMSIGELTKVSGDLQKNLDDVKKNITDINKEISDLDWHALYDESSLGEKILSFGQADKKKKKKANAVKELVAGYKSKEEMNWEEVKAKGKGMKEEAIEAMFKSKMQLFDGQAQIEANMKTVQDQLKTLK